MDTAYIPFVISGDPDQPAQTCPINTQLFQQLLCIVLYHIHVMSV